MDEHVRLRQLRIHTTCAASKPTRTRCAYRATCDDDDVRGRETLHPEAVTLAARIMLVYCAGDGGAEHDGAARRCERD